MNLTNPIFHDEDAARAHLETQRDLAAWMALVTMMAEFTDPPTLATEADAYPYLKNHLEPPRNWRVWIARYEGENPGNHVLRHYGIQLSPFPYLGVQPHKCDTQVTTFVIGNLCAHTFCSTVITGADGDEYAPIGLPQLWPTAGEVIDWSSVRKLGDRGIVSLSEALLRAIPSA